MQKILKTIFETVEDGDSICTLSTLWLSYLIQKATHGEASHAAKVYNVLRSKSRCMFSLSEQTFTGGGLRQVVIVKNEKDGTYTLKGMKHIRKLWLLKLNVNRETLLIENGFQDAIDQVGKEYGYKSLWMGFEFLEKILPFNVRVKIEQTRMERKRVCTEHCIINDSILGLPSKDLYSKDFFITPVEYMKFPYFTVYTE